MNVIAEVAVPVYSLVFVVVFPDAADRPDVEMVPPLLEVDEERTIATFVIVALLGVIEKVLFLYMRISEPS